jgi:hypothetical protein
MTRDELPKFILDIDELAQFILDALREQDWASGEVHDVILDGHYDLEELAILIIDKLGE